MKNQKLEELSDLVRKGIPIDSMAALAVIEYQENLREQRNIARRSTLIGKARIALNKLKKSWKGGN